MKKTLLLAAVLGFTAVAIGAFGAHALKNLLESNGRTLTFELANRYHFFHALALLSVSFQKEISTHWTSLLWLLGIILFSGSLYVLAIFNFTAIAWLTPIGGAFLLAGWFSLIWKAIKLKKPV